MLRKNGKDSTEKCDAILFAAWEGVGKAGYMAAEFLIAAMDADPVTEIDSAKHIYPTGIIVENNIIKKMIFPESIFYKAEYQGKNFIIFPGNFQFPITKEISASSNPAYQYACEIIDVAKSLGCREIFTAGGLLTMIHHSMDSGVAWASNNSAKMAELNFNLSEKYGLKDILHPKATFIAGMNGILPYAATDKNMTATVLLGEVPIYLQSLPMPYPKASKSILLAFAEEVGITFNFEVLDEMIEDYNKELETLMSNFKNSLSPKERKTIFQGIELLKNKPDLKGFKQVFENMMLDKEYPNNENSDNENISEIMEEDIIPPIDESTKKDQLTQEDVQKAIVDIESFFRQENDK